MRNVFKASVVVAICLVTSTVSGLAQQTNPRFGKWKLKSENPPPQSNIMIYEPWGNNGMSVRIETVNRNGEAGTPWGYNTEFDGQFRPLFGREGQTAAVTMVTPEIAQITYKQGEQISQILTNVLSPDYNTIGIIYMRPGRNGRPDSVSFATYERMQ